MPKQIPMPDIVKSVIKGIQTAQNEYIKLTGGYWLSASPEYYITSHVAKKIGLLKDSTYVFLEPWVKGTMDEAGAVSKGKLSFKTRQNGKFDIVLYWSDYKPRSIIEIKNNCYYYSQIKEDVYRIRDVLLKKKDVSKFQFGILAFYTDADDIDNLNSRKRIKKRLKSIEASLKRDVGTKLNIEFSNSKIVTEGVSSWVAGCFFLKPI